MPDNFCEQGWGTTLENIKSQTLTQIFAVIFHKSKLKPNLVETDEEKYFVIQVLTEFLISKHFIR